MKRITLLNRIDSFFHSVSEAWIRIVDMYDYTTDTIRMFIWFAIIIMKIGVCLMFINLSKWWCYFHVNKKFTLHIVFPLKHSHKFVPFRWNVNRLVLPNVLLIRNKLAILGFRSTCKYIAGTIWDLWTILIFIWTLFRMLLHLQWITLLGWCFHKNALKKEYKSWNNVIPSTQSQIEWFNEYYHI